MKTNKNCSEAAYSKQELHPFSTDADSYRSRIASGLSRKCIRHVITCFMMLFSWGVLDAENREELPPPEEEFFTGPSYSLSYVGQKEGELYFELAVFDKKPVIMPLLIREPICRNEFILPSVEIVYDDDSREIFQINEKIYGISEEASGWSPEWKIVNFQWDEIVLKLRISHLIKKKKEILKSISIDLFEWDSIEGKYEKFYNLFSNEIDLAIEFKKEKQ